MPKGKSGGFPIEITLFLAGGALVFVGFLATGFFTSNDDILILNEKIANLERSASRSENSVERMRVLMVALHPDERNNPNLMPVASKISALSPEEYTVVKNQFSSSGIAWSGIPTNPLILPNSVQSVLTKNNISIEDIQIYAEAVNSPAPAVFFSTQDRF